MKFKSIFFDINSSSTGNIYKGFSEDQKYMVINVFQSIGLTDLKILSTANVFEKLDGITEETIHRDDAEYYTFRALDELYRMKASSKKKYNEIILEIDLKDKRVETKEGVDFKIKNIDDIDGSLSKSRELHKLLNIVKEIDKENILNIKNGFIFIGTHIFKIKDISIINYEKKKLTIYIYGNNFTFICSEKKYNDIKKEWINKKEEL